jgi:hypothetical protein
MAEKKTTVSVNGTSISLALVIRIAVVTAVITAGWVDLRYQIASLRDEVKRSTDDRWRATDDLVFMHSFTELNELKMVPHRAATD